MRRLTGAETLYDEGFTLMELMIVILIIAVLVAIAVPIYLSLETRADKAVATYNIKAAEEIHTHIWLELIGRNAFPAGGECYLDGSTPVDALYISGKETKIPWVDMGGSGSLATGSSSGMLASLSPSPGILAQVNGGFSFSINGYYKNGTLVEAGGDSSLGNLPGKNRRVVQLLLPRRNVVRQYRLQTPEYDGGREVGEPSHPHFLSGKTCGFRGLCVEPTRRG